MAGRVAGQVAGQSLNTCAWREGEEPITNGSAGWGCHPGQTAQRKSPQMAQLPLSLVQVEVTSVGPEVAQRRSQQAQGMEGLLSPGQGVLRLPP